MWYARRLRHSEGVRLAIPVYLYSLLYLALLFVAMGIDRALPYGGPSTPARVYILDRAVADQTGAVPFSPHQSH